MKTPNDTLEWSAMACPEGIEPPTHSLEGCCSIRLSYGHKAQRPRSIDTLEPLDWNSGRRTRIRTLDPLLPKQVRYQAALHADNQYSNLTKSVIWLAGKKNYYRSTGGARHV